MTLILGEEKARWGIDWARRDVSAWDLAGEEVQGRNPHVWLRHADEPRTWLFKPHEANSDRPLGEDVVEVVVSAVAQLLGVPAARVGLAVRSGRRGCVVEDLRWPGGEDFPGRVILDHQNGYDPEDPGRFGHSLENISHALQSFAPPPGWPGVADFNAFDVFAGFLVLDALVANTDRHDRNWAVLVPPPGSTRTRCLCASYDHGSCLGFNLSDARRSALLEEGRVAQFAARASARQFEHVPGERRTSLVDLAAAAARQVSADVRMHWLDAVASFDAAMVESELQAGPLTAVSRRFTVALLVENRRRLLDALR